MLGWRVCRNCGVPATVLTQSGGPDWCTAHAPKPKVGPGWEFLCYAGAAGNYELTRKVDDGLLGCSCQSYRFAKGVKTCKHVREHLQVHPELLKGLAKTQDGGTISALAAAWQQNFGKDLKKALKVEAERLMQDAKNRAPKYVAYYEYGVEKPYKPRELPKASVAAKAEPTPSAPKRKRAITFGEDL